MSVAEFQVQVVAEARRAAQSQMSFFNKMMAAKSATSSGEKKTPQSAQPQHVASKG